MRKMLRAVTAVVNVLCFAGCSQVAEAQDRPVARITADLDRSFPVDRIEYRLADGVVFSLNYPDSKAGEVDICFSTPIKRTCRTSALPNDLALRPVVILDGAPNEIMVGFERPDSEPLDIWLFSGPDIITIGDNERACALRGLPLSTPDCL